MKYYYRRKTNYGALTDFSKALNEGFGDNSGRTITNRTAQGFKDVFNTQDMDEETAEVIVHTGMASAALLLNSPDEGHKATGALLSLALFICYQSGK
jgi:hypothetical protein